MTGQQDGLPDHGTAAVVDQALPAGVRQARTHLVEAASWRAQSWRLLSTSFYQPDEALISKLQAGTFASEFRQSVAWLDSDRGLYDEPLDALSRYLDTRASQTPLATLQEVAVDHARLFVGPQRPAASPYESVWTDTDPQSGQPILNGPSTEDVADNYQRHHLTITVGHRDLPDHVATEAEFLCYLCQQEAAAWSAGETGSAKQLRVTQQHFTTQHLARFAPDFAAAITDAAPDSIYAALASLLLAHLTVETGTPYIDVVRDILSSGRHP